MQVEWRKYRDTLDVKVYEALTASVKKSLQQMSYAINGN